MSTTLVVMLSIAIAIMAVAIVLAALRVVRGPDDATRVVMADMVFFCALGIFTLFVMFRQSVVVLDVMLLGSLIGVLSTVALARMISRGRR